MNATTKTTKTTKTTTWIVTYQGYDMAGYGTEKQALSALRDGIKLYRSMGMSTEGYSIRKA